MSKDHIAGGNKRRIQVRAVRRDKAVARRSSAPGTFTATRRQRFLDHLASCCNVTRSAQAAGVTVVTVNCHRRRDPAFAQACAEALEIGYLQLEAMMIERAARGGRYEPGPDAATAPGPQDMDSELALRLLALRERGLGRRTGRAGYAPRRASESELNETILARLAVLARRTQKKPKRPPQ